MPAYRAAAGFDVVGLCLWMYDVDQGGGEARLAIETPYRRLPNLRLTEGSAPHQFPGATFRTYGMLQLQYDGPVAPRSSGGSPVAACRQGCGERQLANP